MIDRILPAIVFPALSILAFYQIFGHAYKGNTWEKVDAHCSAASLQVSKPYLLAYSGIPAVDRQLCGLVTTFESLKIPENFPFNVDLLSALAPIAAMLTIETARTGSHTFLAFQLVLSLIYQVSSHFYYGYHSLVNIPKQRLTAAVTLPWYFLGFILTGAATLHHRTNKNVAFVSQARAESALFGVVLGYIIPTLAMLYTSNYYVTAFWQPFPLWIFLVDKIHLFFRPASTYSSNGYKTVQALYGIIFVGSAVMHLSYVTPIMFDNKLMAHLFIPGLAVPNPKTTTLQAGVLDFIQWDYVFASITALLGCLWTAQSFTQAFGMLLWFIASSATIGPGSALAGVLAWREKKINSTVKFPGKKVKTK